jgi:hypothetical protein
MRFIFLLLTSLVAMGSVPVLNADVFTLKDCNCAFEYPAGWKMRSTRHPGGLVSLDGKTFGLAVLPVRELETIHNPSFVSSFDKKLKDDGFSILKTDYTAFKDAHFRVVDFSKTINGRTITAHCLLAMADQHSYVITITKIEGNPVGDTDLEAILNSFHFLEPPHEQTFWPSWQDFKYALQPPPEDGSPQHETPAYRTAYRIGSLSLFIQKMFIPGVIIGILMALAMVVTLRPRRKK